MPALVLQPGGWLPVPYAIYCGRGEGSDGIDAALGHGSGNHSTFAIQVNWSDLTDACYNLTGFYFWDLSSNYLNRTLPKRHPIFQHHYVSRLTSIKPLYLVGKDATWQPGPFPKYQRALISIDFCQPHYGILSDTKLDTLYPPVTISGVKYRQEWLRYFEPASEIGVEYQQIEAGKMKYAEGAGGVQPTAGTTVVNIPLLEPLSKGTVSYIWKFVPYRGFISQKTLRPENVIKFIGTVNSAPFPGFDSTTYQAGTLRFDGYKVVQINEAPYPESYVGAGIDVGNDGENQFWPSITLDIQLTWSFFDPPHQNSALQGHNLVPYRVVGGDGAPTTGSSWYLASSDGTNTGARILKLADHRAMFLRSTT